MQGLPIISHKNNVQTQEMPHIWLSVCLRHLDASHTQAKHYDKTTLFQDKHSDTGIFIL